jgi:glycine cleavage system H protein
MDGFTYHNIFDTKGIEYLIIIAFFAILIPFWRALNKKVDIKSELTKMIGTLTTNMLRIPQGIFFSKNHTWAHLESSGSAKVGLDDMIQHITGEVKFDKLKKTDESINKGELLTEINQNGKILKIYSPISGTIVDTNDSLYENPGNFNSDPYNLGWIYKIKPTNWIEETNSLFLADKAVMWAKNELQRFKDFLAVSTSKLSPDSDMITMQEGGEIREHVLNELPVKIWEDFQGEFLD